MILESEKVKQIIDNSAFPANLKQRLNAVLPNLGKHTLTGLGREVSRKDSELIAEFIVGHWENFAKLLSGLIRGSSDATQDFLKLFVEMENSLNPDVRIYFLDMALDVRSLASNGKANFLPAQMEKILEYEVSLFWSLPKEEVMWLLQNHILFLAERINLYQDMQVVSFDNDWDYADNFSKTFTELLIQNKEILDKSQAKSVAAWLKEFMNFSSASLSRAGTVEVAEFLVKSPSVQKLTGSEKKVLSEILKLFTWFLNPNINEDEVLNYKEEVLSEKAEQIEIEALKGKPAPPVYAPPSIESAGPPRSAVNIQDILMDKQGRTGGIKNINQPEPARVPPPPPPVPAAPPQTLPGADMQDEIAKKLAELKTRSSQNK